MDNFPRRLETPDMVFTTRFGKGVFLSGIALNVWMNPDQRMSLRPYGFIA
jgi:hypothetical protein